MNNKTVMALICTLSCLFSIIGARITLNSIATPVQCVIHNLPENTPFLLNTSDGTVGELNLSHSAQMDWGSPDNDGVALTSFFTYECVYPDFTVSSNSTSHDVSIEIPKELVTKYDNRLASQYICDDCLREIETIEPQSNFLFLTYENDELHFEFLNEDKNEISIGLYYFTICENTSTGLAVWMETTPNTDERNKKDNGLQRCFRVD